MSPSFNRPAWRGFGRALQSLRTAVVIAGTRIASKGTRHGGAGARSRVDAGIDAPRAPEKDLRGARRRAGLRRGEPIDGFRSPVVVRTRTANPPRCVRMLFRDACAKSDTPKDPLKLNVLSRNFRGRRLQPPLRETSERPISPSLVLCRALRPRVPLLASSGPSQLLNPLLPCGPDNWLENRSRGSKQNSETGPASFVLHAAKYVGVVTICPLEQENETQWRPSCYGPV